MFYASYLQKRIFINIFMSFVTDIDWGSSFSYVWSMVVAFRHRHRYFGFNLLTEYVSFYYIFYYTLLVNADNYNIIIILA